MIFNKDEIANIKSIFEKESATRELVINESRKVLKDSKQAIYLVHQGKMAEAKKLLADAKKVIDRLKKFSLVGTAYTGSFSVALQEYIEAMTFLAFAEKKPVPAYSSVKSFVNLDDYLMGLSDLTGELTRRAVLLSIKKKYKEVMGIRDTIDDIHGIFLQISPGNNELRKKSDAIKWNLQKVENVIYDIELKK